MTFPEGKGRMRIAGAKKVRLIGADDEPEEQQEEQKIELPSWVESEPSYGREEKPGLVRGQYLAPVKPPRKTRAPVGIPVPVKKRTELVKDKRPERRGEVQHLSSTNIFGLTSRSESMYPEAYRPILTKHWEHASDEEYNEIIRRQAMVNKVVSYRENSTDALDLGQTDQAYTEAVGRRNQVMRRRRKPRNYEERKRYEDEARKAPLTRRYMARDTVLENSSFVSAGPLDPKILVPGFSGVIKEVKQSKGTKVKPARRIPPRLAKKLGIDPKHQQNQARDDQGEDKPKPVPKLPEFNKSGPKTKVQTYRNSFGLKSRAVRDYPEAYQPVSQVFWHGLTREQRDDIAKVQAAAMEKVGFEPKTQKQFIEDFNPVMENRYGADNHPAPSQREKVYVPLKFYFAVVLILLGGLLILMTLPRGVPEGLLVTGIIAAAAGIVLTLPIQVS